MKKKSDLFTHCAVNSNIPRIFSIFYTWYLDFHLCTHVQYTSTYFNIMMYWWHDDKKINTLYRLVKLMVSRRSRTHTLTQEWTINLSILSVNHFFFFNRQKLWVFFCITTIDEEIENRTDSFPKRIIKIRKAINKKNELKDSLKLLFLLRMCLLHITEGA